MTNARTLAAFGGGGTNCSAALEYVNKKAGKGDLVIYVSDNESFMDAQHYRQTATMKEWETFKKRNPNAKLVNIDIQPSSTTQTHERSDILNIGGFNDSIFEVIAKFVEFGNDKEMWVSTIENVKL
jgi:60 kDa SS-A/Ro ribonucleoprotein